MKIKKVLAREIFNACGIPTIECELVLDNEETVRASVPKGSSTGTYESVELRDGDQRLFGLGVEQAIEKLETKISPLLVGKEPDLVEFDTAVIELDGTADRSNLGANTILAASMAVCRAQAKTNKMELYEFIAHLVDVEQVSLPFPMFNILNGGVHADNGMPIQEFMIVPVGAQHLRDAMEVGVSVFYSLKEVLRKNGKSTAVGVEGGFAPILSDEKEALDYLMEAIVRVNLSKQSAVAIALDVAASQLYDADNDVYHWNNKQLKSDDLLEKYCALIEAYPIYSIEDGLREDDWDGWAKLNARIGEDTQIVGDDLFASHTDRIVHGLKTKAANAAVIKPNQIGTITEALQAITLCQDYDMNVIISHRSGETNDTFIVDLAVGTSAGQIKAGGCSRGERIAKYNRLLRIEDELTLSLMD